LITPALTAFRPVWIASYPRSGNTFLRIILQNIFRVPTYSLYNVEGQSFRDPSADPLDEAPLLPANWRQLTSDSSSATRLLIKTHGPPEDDSPAIYVVRDGRAATHSYYHYHQKFSFEQPGLVEVIAGACQFGGWSAHYGAWHPKTRPDTLFLRYEELVNQPAEIIPQLAAFLQLEPTGGRLPTFEELQKTYPNFFRRGQNTDYTTQWTPGQMALFNRLHGGVMKELGYPLAPGSEPVSETMVELANSAARLHELYLKQLHNSTVYNARMEQAKADLRKAQVDAFRRYRNHWWLRLGTALRAIRLPRAKSETEET
jgi:hypothetical protein